MHQVVIAGSALASNASVLGSVREELSFSRFSLDECGSSTISDHVYWMESWYGLRCAVLAEDVEKCAADLDLTLSTFAATDTSIGGVATGLAIGAHVGDV
jgi:hypothetical protein